MPVSRTTCDDPIPRSLEKLDTNPEHPTVPNPSDHGSASVPRHNCLVNLCATGECCPWGYACSTCYSSDCLRYRQSKSQACCLAACSTAAQAPARV